MAPRVILAAAAVLLLTQGAWGQDVPRVGRDGYREGVPGVMSPPRPPPRPPESPFAEAYRRAGFPRMVLFFNRDITDAVASDQVMRRQDTVSVEQNTSVVAREPAQPPSPQTAAARGIGPIKQESLAIEAPESPPPGAGEPAPAPAPPRAQQERPQASRQAEMEQRSRVHAERRSEVSVSRPAAGARQAHLDEASQWQFESAFTNRLAAERVRMVDRSTSVRLAGAVQNTLDPQRLEMSAMRDHADVVVLVRAAASAATPGGHIYRVTALETRRGIILADEVVQPPAELPGSAAATAAGDLAAGALMRRLTATWTPAR